MFGKKKTCPCCGEPLKYPKQLVDGEICLKCAKFCNLSSLVQIEDVRGVIEQNHKRYNDFLISLEYHTGPSGYFYVDIDKQQCFYSDYKPPKMEPIVFAFNEVESVSFEMLGQKTVSKSTGGVGRAVVGGALFGPAGAIVGAATAGREEKQVGGTPTFRLVLNLGKCKTELTIFNPDQQTIVFINETFANK